ncbi:hypothetical protein V6N13_080766 [Hibiscus sabdariffa]
MDGHILSSEVFVPLLSLSPPVGHVVPFFCRRLRVSSTLTEALVSSLVPLCSRKVLIEDNSFIGQCSLTQSLEASFGSFRLSKSFHLVNCPNPPSVTVHRHCLSCIIHHIIYVIKFIVGTTLVLNVSVKNLGSWRIDYMNTNESFSP